MKALRIGLCLLAAFAVGAHGVVEVWSESLLEIGAAGLLVLWALVVFRNPGRKIRWTPLMWPLLGLVGIACLQLLFRASVYPYLTRVELLKLVACVIFFFLSVQAFQERADITRLAWFLIFLCFAASLLGIIQHFTSEGKIYWIRRPFEGGDIFGPYVNRNHFAGFVELTLPVALALMVFRGLRRDMFPLAGLLAIVPVGALILSGSRGGIISFALEIGVLALLARTRRRRGVERPHMAAVGIVALAALALVAWLGAGRAMERFSGLSKDVSLARRGSMFHGAARIFLAHPVAGTGLGTLVSVFPAYDSAYDGRLIDHAHNDYIELLADMGLLGGLCGAIFLWLLFRDSLRAFEAEQGHFSRAIHAAAITAIAGLLVHSFVDFNLHIPSNEMLFLLQASLAVSTPLPSEGRSLRKRAGVRAEEGLEGAEGARAPS